MNQPNQPQRVFAPQVNNTDFFFYSPPTAVQLATTIPTATQNIQIDADADFFWVATTYQVYVTGATALTEATNLIPQCTLYINDTGSGKYLSNAPQALGAIAGDGKRPYYLTKPRVFGANSTIQLNWANFWAAGTTYNVFLTLHGFKRYK